MMRAISIWQPWAQLVIAGIKRIETRSWSTAHRGTLVIHAGLGGTTKRVPSAVLERWAVELGITVADFRHLPRGVLLGTVEVVDCRMVVPHASLATWPEIDRPMAPPPPPESAMGTYLAGGFGWHLDRAAVFQQTLPWKGRQRFFNVPDEVIADLIGGRHAAR